MIGCESEVIILLNCPMEPEYISRATRLLIIIDTHPRARLKMSALNAAIRKRLVQKITLDIQWRGGSNEEENDDTSDEA